MSEAIHIIKTEHRNLFRVVNVFDVMIHRLDAAEKPDFALLAALIDYIEAFPDRHHHPKEDRFLFKALRRRDPASHAILDELEEEHHLCAARTAKLREAVEAFARSFPAGRDAFVRAAEDYVRFQTKHLQKEEGIVLPMALRSLTPEDWAEIDAAFADNADPLFSEAAKAEARGLYSKIVNMTPAPLGLA